MLGKGLGGQRLLLRAVENYRPFFFFFNKGEVDLVFFPCLCRYLSEDIFK